MEQNEQIFFFLGDSAKGFLVRQQDIVELESEQNYARVHLSDGKQILVRRALDYCEKCLDQHLFFRANRRTLINMEFVNEIHPYDAKRYSLVLSNGHQIVASRERSMNLRKMKL
jgi:two-component system LytT family response regulator